MTIEDRDLKAPISAVHREPPEKTRSGHARQRAKDSRLLRVLVEPRRQCYRLPRSACRGHNRRARAEDETHPGGDFLKSVPMVITINYEALDMDLCPDCETRYTERHVKSNHPERVSEDGSVKVPKQLKSLADYILKWGPQDIIADEAHFLMSADAKRSRALRRLGRYAQTRRALSGTPDPQGPLAFYAQYAFLAPDIFGTSKTKFIERYANLNLFARRDDLRWYPP